MPSPRMCATMYLVVKHVKVRHGESYCGNNIRYAMKRNYCLLFVLMKQNGVTSACLPVCLSVYPSARQSVCLAYLPVILFANVCILRVSFLIERLQRTRCQPSKKKGTLQALGGRCCCGARSITTCSGACGEARKNTPELR